MPGKKIIPLMLCFLVLLGCTDERGDSITFSVGGAPAELDFWEGLVGEFEAESGIDVVLLRQPTDTDQRRQGLVIALQSRKSDPDVFLMDVVWISQFAASGWLDPLDDITKGDEIRLESFFTNVVDLVDRYDGRLLALPVYVDGGLLYYREDLLHRLGLEKPPETWDQLVEYSTAIQHEMRKSNPDFYGFVWQGAQYEGLVCNFLELAGSNGGGIALRGGHILIDTPENLEASRFMHGLIHTFAISPPSTYTEMKEEEVRIAFQQGNALFERNWPYAWQLHQSEGSMVRGLTGIAPLPRFPSGKSVSTLGGWHIGISKFSDRKPLSREFVKYVLSSPTQKALALHLGWNPGRKDLYEDRELIENLPHFPRLRAVFENALPRPTVPYYAQLSEVIQRRVNGLLSGKLTPEEALQSAQQEAQKVVDRYERK